MITEPPFSAGIVKATVAEPFPAVAFPMVGAVEGVAYVSAVGFDNEPLLVPVNVTGPTAVGVIVNV
jgi:hypothetical protein